MTARPDLPDNWVEEPLSNITGGYLLRILNHVKKPVEIKIHNLISKVTGMQKNSEIIYS